MTSAEKPERSGGGKGPNVIGNVEEGDVSSFTDLAEALQGESPAATEKSARTRRKGTTKVDAAWVRANH